MILPSPILHKTPRGLITIRPALESDDAQLGALRREALTDSPTAFGADLSNTAPFESGYWADKIRKDTESGSGLVIVAALAIPNSDGETPPAETLVGMTGIYRNMGAKARHSGGIWGVYVQPDFRGQHLADDMLALCLIWAKTFGLRLVKLGVAADNPVALRVYMRHGFRVYGVEPAAIHYDGVDVDLVLMAKWI
ncbi:MAG: N-acetyltransferase [Chloroflexota bacterium]|nr:GNAT family N-acetyltransferase [Chloroflexota bacterium]NOG65808.1 GNAT family N-acetyltransferase [Chloroflexota bacterium]GIK66972.1 MAG: N-acetyltransferase [Chloroflexota bacterium]